MLGRSLSGLKSVLTGDEKRDYTPPNPQRLSIFMDDARGLSVDNETGFLTVSAKSEDPETLVALEPIPWGMFWPGSRSFL